MKKRCAWCENTFELYEKYHDEEWGVPVHDDKTHFEFLILEGAQAGLSWSTVFKKREGYRKLLPDLLKKSRISDTLYCFQIYSQNSIKFIQQLYIRVRKELKYNLLLKKI